MHEWLVAITNGTVLVIDMMVLVIIAIGTIQAFVQGLQVMLLPSATGHERRDVWLHYARWLVAGLTFQLAADILATSIAPSWDELVRLATVAAIRTCSTSSSREISPSFADGNSSRWTTSLFPNDATPERTSL